ncbi:MAG: pseudaminic acid synthase [Actinomycetes bacterium]
MIIDGRPISASEPPYVIAEISANHGQDEDAAHALVIAAAEAGADAVKLQHYTPDTITVRSDHPDFVVRGGTLWDGTQLADLYAEAMTPWAWTEALVETARQAGITWFSSPFDNSAVDFLEPFNPAAYKIASAELVDLPLIRYVASQGRPMIMSTGMATLAEIDAAVTAAQSAGATDIALLRCSSAYPAPVGEIDLAVIPDMAERWSRPIGFSDHTLGTTASIVAVALGACVIEKHLIMDRADGGPDSAFSIEPAELRELIAAVRDAHAARGIIRYGPSESELASLAFRRSLRAVRPIAAGESFTADNVRSIRPAGGLAPDEIGSVIGQVAEHDLMQGAPITQADIRSAT